MKHTIKEIAQAAGVSTTTVSLVMNGKAIANRINPDTEKKILDIVQKLHYVPNKNARRFRTSKSEIIGFIAPDATNPFFSSLSYALEQVSKQNGYQLLIGYTNDQVETEVEVINNLLSYSIDGLIIASATKTDESLRNIRIGRIPTVFIDREINSHNISSVSSDNVQGAFDAVNYLCSLGIKDIYYIGGLTKFSTTRDRLAGFIQALKANDIPVDDSKIFQRDYQPSSGYQMMKEIHERNQALPQAVFTGSYTLLEGCLRFINDVYHTIPQNIRIATFDDHPLLDFLPYKIISVRQDTEQLAKEAVRLILDFQQGVPHVENRKIRPKLIIRT